MSANPEKLESFKEYNADDALSKPFLLKDLISKIETFV
jgi:hypothetical protein